MYCPAPSLSLGSGSQAVPRQLVLLIAVSPLVCPQLTGWESLHIFEVEYQRAPCPQMQFS